MVSIVRSLPPAVSGRPEAIHYHVLYSAILQLRFGHLQKMSFLMLWAMGSSVSVLQGSYLSLLPFLGSLGLFSIFPIYVLRKARLHVDMRTQPSLAIEVYRRLFCKSFIRVSIVYSFSSFILAQIYCSKFADLSFFLPKQDFELSKVNERRLYINLLAVFAAVAYAARHVIQDKDRVSLPRVRTDPMTRVIGSVHPVVNDSVIWATSLSIAFVPLYIFLRGSVWSTALYFARFFVTLHKSPALGAFPKVPLHSLLLSFVLLFLWNMANEMFTIYMTLGAFHRGKGISEKSNDPNGTLMTGLQSPTRPFTRTTAFQELKFITQFDGRRRDSIYKDMEKPTTWRQIQTECSTVLQELRKKFSHKIDSIKTNSNNLVVLPPQPNVQTSPTPAPIKMRRENIFLANNTGKPSASSKPERRIVDGLQDPQATRSSSVIGFLKRIELWLKSLREGIWSYVTGFLKSACGVPFRCTVQRRITKLIANRNLVSDAIFALSNLVVHSIIEDTFGTVQRDIPAILNEFDQTITVLENYVSKPPLHWSDVQNKAKLVDGVNPVGSPGAIELDELDIIIEDLTEGFENIVKAFDSHLAALPLAPGVYKRCGISSRSR